MKFTDLEPQFLCLDGNGFRHVDSINVAQGVMFLCPKCFNDEPVGPNGTHRIICWSRSAGVPNDMQPGPGRWKLQGTGYEDLTLGVEPPETRSSVQLTSGCMWHGHVINGEVTVSVTPRLDDLRCAACGEPIASGDAYQQEITARPGGSESRVATDQITISAKHQQCVITLSDVCEDLKRRGLPWSVDNLLNGLRGRK